MLNHKTFRMNTVNCIRAFQILFIFVASWFFFWAHIYEMVIWNKTFIESLGASPQNVALYIASAIVLIFLEIHTRRNRQVSAVPSRATTLQELRRENSMLNHTLERQQKLPSNKIGIALLFVGVLVLVVSIALASSTLAFIGLGLVFWGALFLYARSTKFIRSTILDATTISSYSTLDRIIDDLEYKGNAVYIPPYPKDTYLPEHLEGLKDMVVFISAEEGATMPAIEEMAKKQFLVKNPEGICISPPGYLLVNLFEKELRPGFTKIDQESFYEGLPAVIVNNLELASDFVIKNKNEGIYVKITNSVYSSLYSKEQKLKSVRSVGCPLTSAIACGLAITTGKPVTIASSKVFPELKIIEVEYQVVEG